jgi:hypothetical protein
MTDASGMPTDRWSQFRGRGGEQVLAECIKKAYAELFSTYPNAQERSRSDLETFFRTHSCAGKQAIEKTVSTFQQLCKLADFGEARVEAAAAGKGAEGKIDGAQRMTAASKSHEGFAININIQLTLPETTDEKVYDAFFAALKKHLLQGEL